MLKDKHVVIMKKSLKVAVMWFWSALLIFCLDRISKYLALTYLTPYEPLAIARYLNFTLAYNSGAAFSLFSNLHGWENILLTIVALIISIIIIVWLYRLPANARWMGVALCLILGGAQGNLYDRFVYGYVIDFIDIHIEHWHWPIFNIADSAVCLGAMLLFFLWLKNNHHDD
jgi:signal peptidase II